MKLSRSIRSCVLVCGLTLLAPLAFAQPAATDAATPTDTTTMADRNDNDGDHGYWGLLGLLGLAGLLGKRRHDTVRHDTIGDTTRRT